MFLAALTVKRELEYADGSKATETRVYGPKCAKLFMESPKVQQRAKPQPRPVKCASKKVSGGIEIQIQAGQMDIFEELSA